MVKPGNQGGALARSVDSENHKSLRVAEANRQKRALAELDDPELEYVEESVEDHLIGIATRLRKARRRRAVQQLSSLARLWLCFRLLSGGYHARNWGWASQRIIGQ